MVLILDSNTVDACNVLPYRDDIKRVVNVMVDVTFTLFQRDDTLTEEVES